MDNSAKPQAVKSAVKDAMEAVNALRQTEIIIREGAAAPIRERVSYNVSAAIGSPREFAEVRGVNKETDIVEYSYSGMSIVLKKDVNDYNKCDTISGKLLQNPDLAAFGINTEKVFTITDFQKFIRLRRFLFSEPDQWDTILRQLSAFKAKISTQIEDTKDQRGNVQKGMSRSLSAEIEMSFVLNLPVFVGQPAKKFRVDIGLDVTDASSVLVYLSSADLSELMASECINAINEQLDFFRSKGLACVEVLK
jgi:hypothetical protein